MINAWKAQARRRAHESGQALILIALVLVGLVAITGLAVDGGGLMLLKRDTQNAVDAAIVAATYARCVDASDQSIIDAARNAAADNGFTHDTDPSGDGPFVEVNLAPSVPDPTGYVEVTITAQKPKYLIGIVYSGELWVTSTALGKCNQPTPMASLDGMTATGQCGCSIKTSGDDALFFSNMSSAEDICIGSSAGGGEGTGGLVDGDLNAAGTVSIQNADHTGTGTNGATIEPPPVLVDIADYAPGTPRAQAADAEGKYHAITVGGTVNIPGDTNPNGIVGGLYYIPNAASVVINGTGGSAIQNVEGENIYLTIVTNGDVDFSQVRDHVVHPYMDNLLVFSAKDGTASGNACGQGAGSVSLGNGPRSRFYGTIYAPRINFKWQGAQGYYQGLIIAYSIDMSGNESVFIEDRDLIPPQLAQMFIDG